MFLPLDTSSGLPIYRQIMDQVRRMVASGLLRPGEKLDSVRDLSATLGINSLTVAKAYQELEREGVIEMRRGLGMFVGSTKGLTNTSKSARKLAVQATADRFVVEALQAGLTRKEALRLIAQGWSAHGGKETAGEDKS